MMSITMEALLNAGFPRETWPEDLPEPGEGTIRSATGKGTLKLYRYEAKDAEKSYGIEVVVDTATMPDPAEGVCFMLNQFAYLWRTDKDEISQKPDGSYRRITL